MVSVDSSSLKVEEITLQSSSKKSLSKHEWTLTTGVSTTDSVDGPVIVVKVGKADFDEITRLDNLALGFTSTHLRLTSQAIADTALQANPVVAIGGDKAQQVRAGVGGYKEDENRPTLLSYRLNLTSEEIYFSFSETIEVSNIDETQLTILDRTDGPSSFTHTLKNVLTFIQ